MDLLCVSKPGNVEAISYLQQILLFLAEFPTWNPAQEEELENMQAKLGCMLLNTRGDSGAASEMESEDGLGDLVMSDNADTAGEDEYVETVVVEEQGVSCPRAFSSLEFYDQLSQSLLASLK